MKNCHECSNPFTPGSNRAKWCSTACRDRSRGRGAVPQPVGNRRDGFRVVIDGVERRWRPRYLSEDRGRVPLATRDDLRNLRSVFDGSKSGGAIDRYRTAAANDEARQWALEACGVDIGADL